MTLYTEWRITGQKGDRGEKRRSFGSELCAARGGGWRGNLWAFSAREPILYAVDVGGTLRFSVPISFAISYPGVGEAEAFAHLERRADGA